MVDGYGDGLVIECATEDADYLRTTAFGLLQASPSPAVWQPARLWPAAGKSHVRCRCCMERPC